MPPRPFVLLIPPDNIPTIGFGFGFGLHELWKELLFMTSRKYTIYKHGYHISSGSVGDSLVFPKNIKLLVSNLLIRKYLFRVFNTTHFVSQVLQNRPNT
jgi:hypothetical protein